MTVGVAGTYRLGNSPGISRDWFVAVSRSSSLHKVFKNVGVASKYLLAVLVTVVGLSSTIAAPANAVAVGPTGTVFVPKSPDGKCWLNGAISPSGDLYLLSAGAQDRNIPSTVTAVAADGTRSVVISSLPAYYKGAAFDADGNFY